ncbi:hypothetical protein D8674_018585 [Pyrus ussuriensis x Pyrus communis]|uniref:Uncharacterized protein n=1 Tax=Pyrus ussuriensis x Pyrus communis TaxID=2448454 RepID=A0A5N5G5G4_9ROSA|nr:hypothetical protein D8674_018585 [Pyrus ussuriensis x Pyrus communis]
MLEFEFGSVGEMAPAISGVLIGPQHIVYLRLLREEDENPYTVMVPCVDSDLLPFVIKVHWTFSCSNRKMLTLFVGANETLIVIRYV